MTSHDHAERLALSFDGKNLNEADTRHQIIDPLIHDVFAWPRSRVRCESFINPGYADYVLTRHDGSFILFIEAKREGTYFDLPPDLAGEAQSSYVKVKTLLTNPTIASALMQVREYCLNTGCEFAAVTNGRQWIIFTTFRPSQDWREIRALVINGLEYFSRHYLEAHSRFSYDAIVQRGSLRRLFLDGTLANRELFYAKDRITVYDAPVEANAFASSLRPLADKYFGAIDASDAGFMDNCYVSDRQYDLAFTNAKRRLEDAVTPFLEQFDVRDFHDRGRGGGFASRLEKGVVGLRPADVVVLFGGKGVGKSTFLRKLLVRNPPKVIAKNGVIVHIDLLNVQPTREHLQAAIWTELVTQLDQDGVLASDRNGLCELFEDRYRNARNQDLFALDQASESYNLKLNEMIAQWRADHPYVAKCLATKLRRKHKAIIVTIDNTDHNDGPLQDYCFAIGQSIATAFPCVVVISMREERFYLSSIRGVLDAYQNSGFHITSPEPRAVFMRRIEYVMRLLREGTDGLPSRIDVEVVSTFLRILHENFSSRQSHLANFLTACSHGNIRLALELFRGFMVSGYTNVREMTTEGRWTLQMHQVIKPFMVPSRFFYNEALSRIPNLFQIRSKAHGSHFTALRILSSLLTGHNRQDPPFVPVAALSMPFIDTFAMKEDFRLNMDVLLKHNLIEANNRLDEFTDAVDSVKITTYGMFALDALSQDFTYLELAAEDCAISDQAVAHQIAELSNDEYRHFLAFNTMERVAVRLDRADCFIQYLQQEEERERQLYRAPGDWAFTPRIREAFMHQKPRVLQSARRNAPRKLERLNQRGWERGR